MAEQKVKLTELPAATDTVDTAQLLINQNSTDQKLPVTHFLRAKNNLSDVIDADQARANLNVPSVDDVNNKLTGYINGSYTFSSGANISSRKDYIWDEESKSWYYWSGDLPKEVPAASTPESTGGVAPGEWLSVSDTALRNALADVDGFKYVGSVKSMRELSGINGAYDGQKILVESYHPDANRLAGGILYWNASGTKSSHNGVTIFDPDKSYPTDWTVRSQRVAWYTPSSSGTGVWVRPEKADDLTVDYAGAKPYNPAQVDTESFNAYIDSIDVMTDVKLSAGTYRANIKLRAGIRGLGYSTIFVPDDSSTPIITLYYLQTPGGGWCWKHISDISFDGESLDRSVITCISYSTDTTITNYQNIGRYVFERIVFSNCNVGIRKPFGNIGNVYRNLSTLNVNYGVWATAKPSAPVMHEGNDTFTKCHFNKCYIAAYRTDVTVYGSSLDTVFDQCIFEYNPGFAILQRGAKSNDINVGIIDVRGGHFEGNATSQTVNVDGVDTVPYTLRFSFTRNVRLQGILIGSMSLQQASVSASQCQFSDVQGDSLTKWDIDAYSVINSNDDLSQFGRPLQGLVVNSVLAPHNSARDGFVSPLRVNRNKISVSSPNGFAKSFDGSASIPSVTGSASSEQVNDSILGTYSARWTIPASTTVVLTDPSSMTMTYGRYYVWTVHARWISGDATLQVAQAGGANLSNTLPRNGKAGWVCFSGFGIYGSTGDNRIALRVNGGTSTTVIQTADFQIMTFTRLEEAVSYFNSGSCLYGQP